MKINDSILPSITGSILRRLNLGDLFPTVKEETSIELLKGNGYYLNFFYPKG